MNWVLGGISVRMDASVSVSLTTFSFPGVLSTLTSSVFEGVVESLNTVWISSGDRGFCCILSKFGVIVVLNSPDILSELTNSLSDPVLRVEGDLVVADGSPERMFSTSSLSSLTMLVVVMLSTEVLVLSEPLSELETEVMGVDVMTVITSTTGGLGVN